MFEEDKSKEIKAGLSMGVDNQTVKDTTVNRIPNEVDAGMNVVNAFKKAIVPAATSMVPGTIASEETVQDSAKVDNDTLLRYGKKVAESIYDAALMGFLNFQKNRLPMLPWDNIEEDMELKARQESESPYMKWKTGANVESAEEFVQTRESTINDTLINELKKFDIK